MLKDRYIFLFKVSLLFALTIFVVLSIFALNTHKTFALASSCSATGGTITTSGGYTIHTYISSSTFTVTSGSCNVEVLVVAGGGGGAAMTGAGGGAGGLLYDATHAVTAQAYAVTIGAAGAGQVGSANPGNGSDGGNSVFNTLTAVGGGGAGTNSGTGRPGGSGGGAGHNNTTGGAGTAGQGYAGSGGSTTAPNYGAGGGGGAGAVGGTPTNTKGGDGGVGLAYSISGASVYYAGGGGGGTYMGGTYGVGGNGGGASAPAGNATANTGGGGGGQINNTANGGNGGSGIVIIRYLTPSSSYSSMGSSNYHIQSDSINFAGGLSSSASYKLESTAGEVATGISSSTNYVMNAGYQQMLQSYISISATGNPALPNIGGISAGSSYASTTWTVTTDNPAGYSLSINASQSPALQGTSNGDSVADYVPAGSVPDYTLTVAATSSVFGFNPLGIDVTTRYKNDGVSACGTGINNTVYVCWDGFSTSPKIISQSTAANQPNGATTTAVYGIKIGGSKIQTSGAYSATITVTAVTL